MKFHENRNRTGLEGIVVMKTMFALIDNRMQYVAYMLPPRVP